MHSQRFAKEAELAHQYAAALAQGTLDRLGDISLAFAFEAGPVLPAGQHLDIGLPLIGKISVVVAVAPRQCRPQASQRCIVG